MRTLLAVATIVLAAPAALAFTPEEIQAFQQKRRQLAEQLTEDRLLKFKVFWSVRNTEGSKARLAVLRGVNEAGYTGAMAAAHSGDTAKQLDGADEVAAKKSGLGVQEGRDLLDLLGQYYMGVYSGIENKDDKGLRITRERFGRDFGASTLALVQKHEAEFMPVIAAWVNDTKQQMRDAGF
jgi:hypothetical protein